MTNWDNVTWCAGGNGLNLPAGLEDCNHSCASVFPVSLLSFEAILNQDESVSLEWITAQEVNSDYFEVEYSIDGEIFMPIGKVIAGGNTNEKSYYHFAHEPEQSMNYYRLRQVDIDGEFSYSETRTARLLAELNKPQLFPNPANEMVNIKWKGNESARYQIIDALGKTCLKGNMNSSELAVDVICSTSRNLCPKSTK